MSSFINNLIDRSVTPATGIQPRLRGKFERSAAPSESFSATDEFAPVVKDAAQPVQEKPLQRTELVRQVNVTNLVEKRSAEISPLITSKPLQKNAEQTVDNAKPEKPTRFEPSYTLVAPVQQDSPVKSSSNVYQQPKMQHTAGSEDPHNENKTQVSIYQTEILPRSTLVTKEVHKQLPLVKPNANSNFRIEPQQKMQPKQSPVASFIQRSTVKAEASRTINISIGKIEVRVSQPPVPNTARPKKEGIPIMGLDEYLQQRNQRSQ